MARPLIIAHRGASGERPEHTRAAYDLAIDQGADFIEPDLVLSRDGHLVVRHENEIGATTDVADHAAFAGRRVTKIIDGVAVTGWFTEDFTLAELSTLRCRERLPHLRPANAAYDGREPMLIFDQVIEIARKGSARTGRTIGVCPELKHPSWFASLGLPLEDLFVQAIQTHSLDAPATPLLVQCFEVGTLERLATRITAPLLQLMDLNDGPWDRSDLTYAEMASPSGLARIRRYAAWIGVNTSLVFPMAEAPSPTSLIADAHAAGLKAAAWTFRAENVFLPAYDQRGREPADHGDLATHLGRFQALGLDAAFTDFPGLSV